MSDPALRPGCSFGSVAAEYDRARPGYPREALRWCLPAGSGPVLDLAAGTGKLAAGLLALGQVVVAVEPSRPMLARVPPAARRVAGTAEALPFRAASIGGVLVGQAVHWFDRPVALAQIVRVLRPGGVLALLWNLLDDRVDWVARFAALAGAVERTTHQQVPDPFDATSGLSGAESRRFAHRQDGDRSLLADNAASRSPVLGLTAAARDRVLAEVRALAPADRFAIPYECLVWRAVRTELR